MALSLSLAALVPPHTTTQAPPPTAYSRRRAKRGLALADKHIDAVIVVHT
jgi:hypothetical protein